MKLFDRLRKILSDQRGQDMVEYALLAGFMAVTAATGFPKISEGIRSIFFQLSEYLIIAAGPSTTQ